MRRISINSTEQNQLRDFLLGRLNDLEEGQVEQRLLTDGDFFEEFEMIESELIDQYVHGRLSDEDRERFEKYLMQTPQQYQRVAFATVLHETTAAHAKIKQKVSQLKPRSRQPVPVSALWRIAALVIVVAGLAIALWVLLGRKSEVDRGMLALNEAYKNERLVESRISEINYSPLRTTRTVEPTNINGPTRARAELLLSEAVRNTGDAASHHALGRLYLAGKEFDQAKQELEQALKLDSGNAQLHSDLAAALLESGKAERTRDETRAAESFARSLEHLNRALELDQSLLEAQFNRALLLEETSLLPQAEKAWQIYLQKDFTSQWADEARRHLQSIQQQNRSTLERQ